MDDFSSTIILDNGAYNAKLGLCIYDEPQIIPNCIMKAKAERRRAFIGNQIEECRDASGLFYILCFQKGYLLNWDVQKSVWDHIFSTDGSGITLHDHSIIITEPQMNFIGIQEAMIEILFEEYHCKSVLKTTTTDLAAFNYIGACDPIVTMKSLNCVIIDIGFSFAHVVPYVKGKKIERGIRRIEIGGKVLTNHLKELISYRHLNVMDESYVVNQIKEDVCFVSQNFNEDMNIFTCSKKRTEITVDYVLPDYTTIKRGFVRGTKKKNGLYGENVSDMKLDNANREQQVDEFWDEIEQDDDQQSVRLCNERFTVPELLFNPSDVGIQQIGIPEAVIDALNTCPAHAHSELLKNILVIGGTSKFPGFIGRLTMELRSLATDDLKVHIIHPENPITYAWYGGKELAASDNFGKLIFTRDDYEENGYDALNDDE